jgi:hypothetical protein
VDVDSHATTPLVSLFTVTGGGSATASKLVATPVSPQTCAVSGDGTPSINDVPYILNEVLGFTSPIDDLNRDFSVNILDAQKVVNAAPTQSCPNN